MKNLKRHKPIRHGDLALIPIKSLPKGLEEADTDIIMTGSHGNDHKVINGKIFFKNVDIFAFGYLQAEKGCKLLHLDHGEKAKALLREAPLAEGIYELRKQQEETNEGMRPVQD